MDVAPKEMVDIVSPAAFSNEMEDKTNVMEQGEDAYGSDSDMSMGAPMRGRGGAKHAIDARRLSY